MGGNEASNPIVGRSRQGDQSRRRVWAEENDRPEARRDEAGLKYDSAERREWLAVSLDGVADKEGVQRD
ncbi:hypothetical protein [Arthrobacter polaris]|uniref:hypothetical protein n=1 Tax=Arthrobacter polaris TaxID=2813727 RepID=UPI001F3CC581|nr:hypothetical protein [Arthrobacter polaris]UIK89788.1 hypothetical protein J0916_05370 [Arthrobacter polaris]